MPTLATISANLTLLQSSTTCSEFHFLSTSSEVDLLSRYFFSPSSPSPSSSSRSPEEKEIQKVNFALRLCKAPRESWLRVFLTVSPDTSAHEGEWEVEVSSPTSERKSLDRLQSKVRQIWQEVRREEEDELQIWTLWMDCRVFAEEILDGDDDDEGEKAGKEKMQETARKDEKVGLKRSIFWSYHLIAPSKRKDFAAFCPELSIWGVVKIGYPGYLVFEGPLEGVEEMERRVKGMQWHALTLRSSHHFSPLPDNSTRSILEKAILFCPLARRHAQNHNSSDRDDKVRTGYEEVDSVGEVVERLKSIGMEEEEIIQSLGLRTSKGGGLH